ncbi:hypothetical protein FBU59_002376 [Linderina macrospora]|uniref:Uncharacterized protein n=1 Tax=Linderina macrospora TaxID=4868 RepID=A0ACC1JBL4_9FUNG|nr:hypothetical protein FBU59_002376 [Linderina macrospora]
MVRRCAVKIQLGTGKQPLPPNQRIEVPRLLPGVGEPEVFGYFRQFGTIIRIEVDQQTASVWYANTPEAQRAGSKVNGCGLVGTVPVYEILDSDEEEDGVVTGNNMRLDIVEERGWVRPSAAVRAPSLAPQVPKPEPPTEQTKADLPMATAKRPRPEPTVARKPVQPAAKQSVPVQAPAQPPLRPTAMTEPKGDTTQTAAPNRAPSTKGKGAETSREEFGASPINMVIRCARTVTE